MSFQICLHSSQARVQLFFEKDKNVQVSSSVKFETNIFPNSPFLSLEEEITQKTSWNEPLLTEYL